MFVNWESLFLENENGNLQHYECYVFRSFLYGDCLFNLCDFHIAYFLICLNSVI
jgi:hypothetical protein